MGYIPGPPPVHLFYRMLNCSNQLNNRLIQNNFKINSDFKFFSSNNREGLNATFPVDLKSRQWFIKEDIGREKKSVSDLWSSTPTPLASQPKHKRGINLKISLSQPRAELRPRPRSVFKKPFTKEII